MKKLLAIIALISIASLADARIGVGGGVGVGARGVGVGRPVARAAGVGVVGRPVARAAIASDYAQQNDQGQVYSSSYSTSRPVARGAARIAR